MAPKRKRQEEIDDFILTLSDEETPGKITSDPAQDEEKSDESDVDMNFEWTGDQNGFGNSPWDNISDNEDIFGKQRKKHKIDKDDKDDFEGFDSENDDDDQDVEDDHVMDNEKDEVDELPDGDDSDDSEVEDAEQLRRREAFFAPKEKYATEEVASFKDLNLSRPIMRGITTANYTHPTPIQRQTIPVALTGKDVVGSAVTGSGKTAAFLIPIFERLLHRPNKIPMTRVVILVPTRELATQCAKVATALSTFTDIRTSLVIGGTSTKQQEAMLKERPDIVIGTPGRFIDHVLNTAVFAVDKVEILVLDEADRMLDDGFADQLDQCFKLLPKSRQTMLFSATMTDSVDKLIRAGLNQPVRLAIGARRSTTTNLTQEFLRLRPGKEDKRMAALVWLCRHAYRTRTIVFFRAKRDAHRTRLLFDALGLAAEELHGARSQAERYAALERFRSGDVHFLLATDVASRGLDVRGVLGVVNFEAPQSFDIYLHRIGRTARAGQSGRACTIAAEEDRKVVRKAVKAARTQGGKVRSVGIPPAELEAEAAGVLDAMVTVKEKMRLEKEDQAVTKAQEEIDRAENLVKYQDEIKSRPRKEWFEGEKDKQNAKVRGYQELNGVSPSNMVSEAKVKKQKKTVSNKQKKKMDLKEERKGAMTFKKTSKQRITKSGKSRR